MLRMSFYVPGQARILKGRTSHCSLGSPGNFRTCTLGHPGRLLRCPNGPWKSNGFGKSQGRCEHLPRVIPGYLWTDQHNLGHSAVHWDLSEFWDILECLAPSRSALGCLGMPVGYLMEPWNVSRYFATSQGTMGCRRVPTVPGTFQSTLDAPGYYGTSQGTL